MTSVSENGLRVVLMTREPEFSTKSDIVLNPSLNISHKIREVLLSYKSLPDYFIPLKVDSLD